VTFLNTPSYSVNRLIGVDGQGFAWLEASGSVAPFGTYWIRVNLATGELVRRLPTLGSFNVVVAPAGGLYYTEGTSLLYVAP
jgi:hypothetical protein